MAEQEPQMDTDASPKAEKKERLPPAISYDEIYADPRYCKMVAFVDQFDRFAPRDKPNSKYDEVAHRILDQHLLEMKMSDQYQIRKNHLDEIASFYERFQEKTGSGEKPVATFTTFGFDFDEKYPGCCDYQPEEKEEERV